jgi:hypothetical protein
MNHRIEFSIHQLTNLTMEEYINSLATEFKNFIKTEFINQTNDNLTYGYRFVTQQSNYILDENNNMPENMIVYKLEDYLPGSEAQEFFQFNDFNLKTYDLSKFYDAETLAIVNEVYKKDFELFGYDIINNI